MNNIKTEKRVIEPSMNFWLRLIFALVGGFLSGAAYYPSHVFGIILGWNINLGWMGFIAPVLFFLAVAYSRRVWAAILLSVAFGFMYYINVMTWISGVTFIGLLGSSVIYIVSFSIMLGAMIYLFKKYLGSFSPLMIASGWVGYEFLLSWFWGRTPWTFMGYSAFWDFPFIQFADVFGIWGVSFVMILFSATIAGSIHAFSKYRGASTDLSKRKARSWRRMFLASVLILVITHIYGVLRLWTLPEPEGETITVALTQPSIPQDIRNEREEKQILSSVVDNRQISIFNALANTPEKEGIYKYASPDLAGFKHDTATTDIVTIIRKTDNPVQLVIDSEASFTYSLEPFVAKGKNYRFYSEVRDYIAVARKQGWHLQISAIEDPLNPMPDAPPNLYSGRNCSHLFSPEGEILQTYQKIELVPFGEFVPLLDYTPIIYDVLQNVVGRVQHFEHGKNFEVFELPKSKVNQNLGENLGSVKYGVAICFETGFPYVNRELVKRGAEFIVVHSSDGWFLDTYEPEQIWTQTQVRAIENRVGFVRAVNSGISGACDQTGRMIAVMEKDGNTRGIAGALVLDAPKGCATSLYLVFGDIFAHFCTLLSLALFILLSLYAIFKSCFFKID